MYSINLLKSLEEIGYQPKLINTEINKSTENIGTLSILKYLKVFQNILQLFIKTNNSHVFLNINLSNQGIIRTFLYFFSASFFSKEINLIFHEGNIIVFYEKYNNFLKKIFKYLVSNSSNILLLDKMQFDELKNYCNTDKLYILGAYREDLYKNVQKNNNIIFYSNLIEQKGAEDAIETFLNLNKEIRSNWKFIVAGAIKDVEFYDKLFNMYNKKVTFFVDKTYEENMNLLNASKIFIYPTRYKYEQQPAVLIEAMMNKMVILSYDWAGVKEMLPTHCSFISKNNINDLTELLRNILNDINLDNHMENSRMFYLDNFHKKNFVANVEKLFNSLK